MTAVPDPVSVGRDEDVYPSSMQRGGRLTLSYRVTLYLTAVSNSRVPLRSSTPQKENMAPMVWGYGRGLWADGRADGRSFNIVVRGFESAKLVVVTATSTCGSKP